MGKLNLPPIKKRLTKNQIMRAWHNYYKKCNGIPSTKAVSDGEVFEQMAIEQYKGTLDKWINRAFIL